MKTLLWIKLNLAPLSVFWLGALFGARALGAACGAALAVAIALWRRRTGADPYFAWLCAAVLAPVAVMLALGWPIDPLASAHFGMGIGMGASVLASRPWTAAFSAASWAGADRNALFMSVNSAMSTLWAVVFLYLAAARFLVLPAAASWLPLAVAVFLSPFLPLALVRRGLALRIRAAQGAAWPASAPGRPGTDADVAVVGAGLGGLTAAALLAQAGHRVVVLEQHVVPGGFAHHWWRKGRDGEARPVFRFDSGVHDVSGWWDGGPVHGLFGRLGLAHRIDWRRMNHRFVTDGATLDVAGDWNSYAEQLAASFPADAAGIRAAMTAIRAIYESMYSEAPANSGIPGAPQTVSAMLQFARRHPLAVRWMERPFAEFLAAHIDGAAAQRSLAGLSGYITDMPGSMTVARMVPLFGYYLHGGYYPAGGSGKIASALVEAIEQHGGCVRLKTAVEQVLIDRGSAAGVRLARGGALRTSSVVLNADLLSKLVEPSHWPADFRRQIDALRPSCSAFGVHLGVRGAFDGAQPIIHVSGRQGHAEIVIPSLIDPSAAPRGYSTVEILQLVPHEAAREWFGAGDAADDRARRRGAEYRARKARTGDELIALAETALPGLSQRIVFRAESSPLTYRRYDWSSAGSIYGCDGAPGMIRTKSPIPGLVFAGAATHGAGVEAVMISGARAAEALVPGLLESPAGYRADRPAYGFFPVLNSIASGVPVSLKASRK